MSEGWDTTEEKQQRGKHDFTYGIVMPADFHYSATDDVGPSNGQNNDQGYTYAPSARTTMLAIAYHHNHHPSFRRLSNSVRPSMFLTFRSHAGNVVPSCEVRNSATSQLADYICNSAVFSYS